MEIDDLSTATALRQEALAGLGVKIVHEFAKAFSDWPAVPPSLIELAEKTLENSTEVQHAVIVKARKIAEDIGAAVSLADRGFAGPTHALLRVCRENAMSMLYLSLAEEAEAKQYLCYLNETHPAYSDLRRHKQAKRLLSEHADDLLPEVKERFETALLAEVQVDGIELVARNYRRVARKYSFASLVVEVTRLLDARGLPQLQLLMTTVIDYWIESEVIHSGQDALYLYHAGSVPADLDLERVRDILLVLKDLRLCATITHVSLLAALDLEKDLPMPAQVQELSRISNRAQSFFDLVHETERNGEAEKVSG